MTCVRCQEAVQPEGLSVNLGAVGRWGGACNVRTDCRIAHACHSHHVNEVSIRKIAAAKNQLPVAL